MKSTIQTCVLAASLTLTGYCFAQVAAPAADTPPIDAKPKPDPTAQQQKIADLIKQLGADDFAKRDEASDALQKLGNEALPALREALKSDDPSIRSYAEYLVPKLEGGGRNAKRRNANELDFARQAGQMGVGAGAMPQRLVLQRANRIAINVAAHNGAKTTNITDGDRQITIQEDANGIRMTVIETPKDGKREVHEYEAKSIDELRKEQPDAAQIYDRYTNRANAIGGVNARVLRLAPPAMIDNGDDEIKIQDRLIDAGRLQEKMMVDGMKIQEKALIDRDARLRDFIAAQNRNLGQNQAELLHSRLKAETEALEAQLAQIEVLHKQLLERTKAAQQRLAELEKQQAK